MSDGRVNGLIILMTLWSMCILGQGVYSRYVSVRVPLTAGCQNGKGKRAVIMASHVQQKHQREVICCSIFNQQR